MLFNFESWWNRVASKRSSRNLPSILPLSCTTSPALGSSLEFPPVLQTRSVFRGLTNSGRCFCAQCQEGGCHLITRLLHINRNLTSCRPSVVPSWLEGVSAQPTPNEPDWKEGTFVLDCCSTVIKNTEMLPCANQTTLSPKTPGGLDSHRGWWARRGISEKPQSRTDLPSFWQLLHLAVFDLKSPSLPQHLRCLLMVALKGWYFTEKCRFNPIRLCLTSEPATISFARNSRYIKAIQTIPLHPPQPSKPSFTQYGCCLLLPRVCCSVC